MKTLKIISTAVMLITGIITAITGAVETIIKFMETLRPEIKNAPIRGETFNKGDFDDFAAIPSTTFFQEYQGPIILLIGALLIYTSLWLTNKYKN